MPPVKGFKIPDWANPANASVLDSPLQKAARTIGQFLGINDPQSQIMGLATAPIDVPAGPAQTIRAFHGSPYDFERFDLSKIGTGEGAQAYGHGLYFAENPAVAHEYRKTLAYLNDDESRQILDTLPQTFKGPDNVRGIVNQIHDAVAKGEVAKPSEFASAYELPPPLQAAYKKAGEILDHKGKTYEVNIHASPDELLDWDKPLSQQPQKVQEAIRSSATYQDRMAGYKAGRLKNPDEASGSQWISFLKDEGDLRAAGAPQPLDTAGSRGTPTVGAEGQYRAEQALRQAGIKGIQYLDQGSRAAGSGTRNFVIFDDKIIEIAKKYGISLPAAASLYKTWQQYGAPDEKGVK